MKSDEEFLAGIYKKAEQRKKEEAGQSGAAMARMLMARIAMGRIAMAGIAACLCLFLAFSVYRKKTQGNAESINPEDGINSENGINSEDGIQVLNLEESLENPADEGENIAEQYMGRTVGMPVTLFGTVLDVQAAEASMSILYLDIETFGKTEVLVTCAETFTKGEEVALLVTAVGEMYYLTDFGQKYKKVEDGLYYNALGNILGEALYEDNVSGETFPEDNVSGETFHEDNVSGEVLPETIH